MIEDYLTFLRFKSISADNLFQKDCLECVKWLENFLQKEGFKTELLPTSTNPALFASDLSAGPLAPTLLFYQHYDVQPVDPLELWKNNPFEPQITGDRITARGAQDNKGQCFYVLQALKDYKKNMGSFPVNVKIIIEGDEEMGSIGLKEILPLHKEKLQADYLLVTDLGIKSLEEPAITLGTRGLITMELTVSGGHCDLHSGEYGGIVYNPLHALVEMLAKVRDESGRITIEGFYDNLIFTQEDLDTEWDDKISAAGGESRLYTPFERAWLQPTFEINGLKGGYSGPGFKTVIPGEAMAKISCRLVPGQNPQTIFQNIEKFFTNITPPSIHIALKLLQEGSSALRTSSSSPIALAAITAYEKVFGKRCGKIMAGGTIGIAGPLASISNASVIFLGLGLSSDQIHAPNENFSLSRIQQGHAIITHILDFF